MTVQLWTAGQTYLGSHDERNAQAPLPRETGSEAVPGDT